MGGEGNEDKKGKERKGWCTGEKIEGENKGRKGRMVYIVQRRRIRQERTVG